MLLYTTKKCAVVCPEQSNRAANFALCGRPYLNRGASDSSGCEYEFTKKKKS